MKKSYTLPNGKDVMNAGEPVAAYEPQTATAFTTYQMQILDSISRVRNEEEMCDIRNLIAGYFSNKALDAMDKLCDEGKLSTETIESWHSEHMHTPYVY